VGRAEGVSEQQLADLAAFEGSPAFSELEKQVLRYAAALTRTPADVPKELFNSLREQFNPQQMVELTAAIAWEISGPASTAASGSRQKGSRWVPCARSRLAAITASNEALHLTRAALLVARGMKML
jgi:3-polyprenyl-4-hydroxybenzoate decarboxylase